MFQLKRRRNIQNIKFIVKITNVFGIDRKLPKNIFALQKKHLISFDVENPDEILLDTDIKNPNSVAHGDVGDLVFTKLD